MRFENGWIRGNRLLIMAGSYTHKSEKTLKTLGRQRAIDAMLIRLKRLASYVNEREGRHVHLTFLCEVAKAYREWQDEKCLEQVRKTRLQSFP